jgi:hypothetical protein
MTKWALLRAFDKFERDWNDDAPRAKGGEDVTLRFVTIRGLPGVVVHGPDGPVQTAAFEIQGDVHSSAVRGVQSGQVAAFSGGSAAAPERSRTSSRVLIRGAALRRGNRR